MTIKQYKDVYEQCETIRKKLYEVHDIMLGLAGQGVLTSEDFGELGAMIRKLDEIDQRTYDACEEAHPHIADFTWDDFVLAAHEASKVVDDALRRDNR